MSLNQLTLIGNLGQDPEMTYSQTGTAITKFSVAVNQKNASGEQETMWVRCTAFGKSGETINAYITKGQEVFVQGRLQVREYERKDGTTGTAVEMIVDKFTFLGNRQAQEEVPAKPAPKAGAKGKVPAGRGGVDPDEVPF